MSDTYDFLSNFYNEEIYVVKEDQQKKIDNIREKPIKPEFENNSEAKTANIPSGIDISTKLPDLIEPDKHKSPKIDFKGDNTKDLLVLVGTSSSEDISTDDEQFLNKILHAIGIGIEEIALVNIGAQKIKSITQLDIINFSHLICFTTDTPDFLSGDKTELYGIFKLYGKTILLCHELKEIAADKNKKVRLWQQLKQLFPSK